MTAVVQEVTAMAKRIRTVEYDPGWGWVARDPQGREVIPDFYWSSHAIARDVARDAAKSPQA